MLRDKKAVIFDLDGTITDSMWVWKQIDIDFFIERKIEMPPTIQQDIEGMSFVETADYFVKTFHLPETSEQLQEIWNQMALQMYRTETPLKPGITEFMEYLKAHQIRMGIGTSNSRLLLDVFLEARGMAGYIDAATTGCEVTRGKPAPDIYLATAAKLAVDPKDCLIFEDIPMGIMAGKAAGMDVCAVEDDYSAGLREEKRNLADYYITDYRQILNHTYEVLR